MRITHSAATSEMNSSDSPNFCVIIYYLNIDLNQTTNTHIFIHSFLLANTGGLLGLFMGFSVVSLVEIFYFIALRPYFSRFTRSNQNLKPTSTSHSHFNSNGSNFHVEKGQRNHVWSHTQTYDRNLYLNNYLDRTLPFYRKNFPNIEVNQWKPTPFVH